MTAAFSQLQQQFKPKQVQIIFITEAVQPGKVFFYLKNANGFRSVKEAFSQVFGEFKSNDDFLKFFKENGCYIDYLCPEIINGLTTEVRQKVRTDSIQPLSERLVLLQPKVVITVMKVMENKILEAVKLSAITSVKYAKAIAFPAHSKTNADKCVKELVLILNELLERGILVD